MGLYTGVTGKVSIKGTTIIHMENWSVELTRDIHEVVPLGAEYKEKYIGIKDWSASTDGKADFAADGGQKALVDAFQSGEKVEADFYLDEGTFFSGDAFIESLSVDHSGDGIGNISISLAGTEAATFTAGSGT